MSAIETPATCECGAAQEVESARSRRDAGAEDVVSCFLRGRTARDRRRSEKGSVRRRSGAIPGAQVAAHVVGRRRRDQKPTELEAERTKPQEVLTPSQSGCKETSRVSQGATLESPASHAALFFLDRILLSKRSARGRACRVLRLLPAGAGVRLIRQPVAQAHRIFRDVLFLANFLLIFNTAFTNEHGELVTSRYEIAKSYLRGWFLPDLVSSIPVRLLFENAATREHTDPQEGVETVTEFGFAFSVERLAHVLLIAHFLWFVRLNRSERGLLTWLAYSRYSRLLRIAWVVLFVVLISHYVAYGWALLDGRNDLSASPLEEYIASFYDAHQLLQGQGVPAATVSQNVFASFAILLGSIVLAIVFGHVVVLVVNFNANSTNYQRKMEAVFAIASKMQLPEPLRERIHQYYDHLWREYEPLDGEIEHFSKNLSHTLELEVVLCKYMDLIMGIPFWVDCSPDFQKQLMLNLRVRVYMPDDYVIRRGEVDEEFYMISRGSVELATGSDSFKRPIGGPDDDDGGEVDETSKADGSSRRRYRVDEKEGDRKQHAKYLRRLSKGQAFGELALLMNYSCMADVCAITYVEMCVLNRKDFQEILTRHPEDRKKVVSAMLSTCMLKNKTEAVFCPLKEMVHSVYSSSGSGNHLVGEAAQIGAIEAASLILGVINPDLEDKSIKF